MQASQRLSGVLLRVSGLLDNIVMDLPLLHQVHHSTYVRTTLGVIPV